MNNQKMKTIATFMVIAAFAVIGFNTKALANPAVMFDSCRNVKFTVRNDRNGDIEIKRVSYYNANENRWQDEDVPNTLIRRGQTSTFGREDLRDSESDKITKIKFEYEDKNSRQTMTSQIFVPSNPECIADKNFGLGQGWAITGSSPVNEGDNGITGDKCKSVSFNYTNGRQGDIKVKSVKYFNRQSGKWNTDNLANEICPMGQKCVSDWGGGHIAKINLEDANGDDITKVIFIYEYKANQRRSRWSGGIESKTFEPSQPKCQEGKVFGLGQNWTIGNDSDSGSSVNGTDSATGEVTSISGSGVNEKQRNGKRNRRKNKN